MPSVTLLLVLFACAACTLAQAHARPRPSLSPLPQLIVVPGAAISATSTLARTSSSTLPFMPEFSAEARATGAAVAKNLTDLIAPSPSSLLFSGGYNIGVRYLLNGTVLVQPNNSFAAYALARTFASEAETMREFVTTYLLGPAAGAAIMIEEDSASTEENVQFISVLLTRLLTYTFPPNTTLVVGLLTSLYHMPKFWSLFLPVLQSSAFAAVKPVALYAEDFVCLRATTFGGADWISAVTEYYAANYAPSIWNATAIEQIMQTRRGGDLSVSVGSLCGAACVV